MKASIDIKTPDGKSLDKFPVIVDSETHFHFGDKKTMIIPFFCDVKTIYLKLYPGDVITITLLPS